MSMTDADKVFAGKVNYISSKMDRMTKDVESLEKSLLNMIYKDYISRFQYDGNGDLKNTPHNAQLARQLNNMLKKFSDKFLKKLNTHFGKDLLKLTTLGADYYYSFLDVADIEKSTLDAIGESMAFIDDIIGIKDGKIIKNGYLDRLTEADQVKKELADYVLKSVANRKGMKEFNKGFSEIVSGNDEQPGVLSRYYQQYAWDTWNNVDATVNKHYAENLDMKYFLYAGSLIETSRPFCRKRAGKVFSIEETKDWKNDPTLIDKKTKDAYNPLIERGRYRCRHYIKYLPDEYAAQLIKDQDYEEYEKETEGEDVASLVKEDSEGYVIPLKARGVQRGGDRGDVQAIRIKKAHVKSVIRVGGGGEERILELTPAGAVAYHEAIAAGAKAHKYGAAVEVKSVKDYKKTRMFITDDGGAGLCVKPDGDIVSVFKNPDITSSKWAGGELMMTALDNGGKKLDCFAINDFLPNYYMQFGFVAAARVKFNRDFAPEGWDYKLMGEPDIVYMVHNGDPRTKIEKTMSSEQGYGKYHAGNYPYSEYDDAIRLQDERVKLGDYASRIYTDKVAIRFKNQEDAVDYLKYKDEYASWWGAAMENINEKDLLRFRAGNIIKYADSDSDFQSIVKNKMDRDFGYMMRAVSDWQDDTHLNKPMHLKLLAQALEDTTDNIYPQSFGDDEIASLQDYVQSFTTGHKRYMSPRPVEQYLRMRAFNQAYLEAIEHGRVELYRGTDGRTGSNYWDIIDMDRPPFIELTDAPLVGYTTSMSEAAGFGSSKGGIDVRWTFEIDEIFLHKDLWSNVNRRYMRESEFIILGRSREVPISDVQTNFKSFGDY